MLSTFEKTKTHEARRAAIQRQMEAMETLGSRRNITTAPSGTAENLDGGSGNKTLKQSGSLESARRFLWDQDEEGIVDIVSSRHHPTKTTRGKHSSTVGYDRRNLYSTASYRDPSGSSSIFTSLGNLLSDNPGNETGDRDSSQPSHLAYCCSCFRDSIITLMLPILSCFGWMTRNQRGRNLCILLAVILIIMIPIIIFAPEGSSDKFHYSTRGSVGSLPSLTGSIRHEAISNRIINSGITTKSLLEQIRTPQKKAFNWIVVEDPAQLDPDDKYILTRYSLAVFYFSTHGEEMLFQPEDNAGAGPMFNAGPTFNSIKPGTVKNPNTLLGEDKVTTMGGELARQPNWLNERGWLSGSGYCSWWGIKCHHRNGTPVDDTVYDDNNGLILLNMTENNVRGILPSELFLANPEMRGLSLSGNGFFGTVPAEIGTLTQMQYLALANNFFTGTLPKTFMKMTDIDRLYLDGNYFSGAFFPRIVLMTKLESLSIYNNKFSGTIPANIDDLTNLNALYMDINDFTGSIPTSLGNLKKMEDLRLRRNRLTGSIPASFGGMSSLKILYLDRNDISGTIPTSLGQINHLHELHLQINKIKGLIPTEVGLLKELGSLYLDNNLLTGSVPSEIANAQKLETVFLQDNKLTGTMPKLLERLSNLKTFLIYSNNIKGTVPQEFCNLKLEEFKSDCAGKEPEVVCSCCTKCV